MTQWTKEDLYGPNSIPNSCKTCGHCFKYAEDSDEPAIRSHWCTLKSRDVHPEELCPDWMGRRSEL